MTISQLKRKALIQFALYFLLSIGLTLLLVCIITYNKKLCDENQNTMDKIHSISVQIVEAHEREVTLNKHLGLWKRLSSSSLRSSRYISELNFELSQLYKKYCILNPGISISIPERVEVPYASKHTKIIRSKVTLSFSSISDKHIFLFLQSIPSLPGYVMIKSLVLSKEKNIDTITMNQILNGDMIEIVRANIVFDWYTVLKNED